MAEKQLQNALIKLNHEFNTHTISVMKNSHCVILCNYGDVVDVHIAFCFYFTSSLPLSTRSEITCHK